MRLGMGFGTDVRCRTGFTPFDLFRASEQGAWYDPSDFSTLYQDAAGTTPVTALGQSVGLVLDKRLGLVLGSELVSNGGFDTDTVWVKGTGWSIGSGKATFNPAGQSANSDLYAALSSSKDSAQTADISANGAFTVYLAITAGGGHVKVTGEVSGRTAGTIRVLAASGRVYIRALNGIGFNGSIDNISVKELPGNHAYQTTALSRPTVEARVNLATATEGAAATWTVSNVSDAGTPITGFSNSLQFGDNSLVRSAFKTPSVTSGVTYTVSIFVQMDDGALPVVGLNSTTGDFCMVAQGNVVATAATVTRISGSLYRVSATRTSGATAASNHGIIKYTTQSARTFRVIGIQVEEGTSATTYQKVNTATDYVDVGAPRYLSFDGTDDGMATPSINFTGTDKMTVWAGVRKNSDATAAAFVELSASANTNNGAFVLFAPLAAGNIVMRHRGASAFIDATAATYTAPITAVVSATSTLGTGAVGVNANKTPFTNTGVTGGGNYGNYPLYIGRRAGTSLPFNGRLYGLIVRGAASSESQIAAAEAWMNSKTRAY